jgi:DNA repair protein RadA/Sms
VVPKANAPKSGRVGEMEVIGVERLSEALEQATD